MIFFEVGFWSTSNKFLWNNISHVCIMLFWKPKLLMEIVFLFRRVVIIFFGQHNKFTENCVVTLSARDRKKKSSMLHVHCRPSPFLFFLFSFVLSCNGNQKKNFFVRFVLRAEHKCLRVRVASLAFLVMFCWHIFLMVKKKNNNWIGNNSNHTRPTLSKISFINI